MENFDEELLKWAETSKEIEEEAREMLQSRHRPFGIGFSWFPWEKITIVYCNKEFFKVNSIESTAMVKADMEKQSNNKVEKAIEFSDWSEISAVKSKLVEGY